MQYSIYLISNCISLVLGFISFAPLSFSHKIKHVRSEDNKVQIVWNTTKGKPWILLTDLHRRENSCWKSVVLIQQANANNVIAIYQVPMYFGILLGALVGNLGISIPSVVGNATTCRINKFNSSESCLTFGDYANLSLTEYLNEEENIQCTRVQWVSRYARILLDCFSIDEGIYLYGGGTIYNQTWPLSSQIIPDSAFVTGDYTSTSTGAKYGGVIENYFLFSNGIALHIDEDTPLFVDWNPTRERQLCISAKNEHPYKFRESLELKYDVCVGNDILHVHKSTFPNFYEKPMGSPDQDMMLKPFWSTWNEFNANVNQSIVIQHARRILEEGFSTNSHFEIDDGWEECYGQNTFDPLKFPDPAGMVQELNELGFRVTLWTHPFINYECKELFNEAFSNDYLLKDKKGKSVFTTWWHGDAGVVDFTNSQAKEWWTSRLKQLQILYGIDAFKFDAGETDRLPWEFVLSEGSELLYPNDYTRAYVEAVSQFGGLIEVRTGRRSQDLPIFTRMLDKGSRWGYDNGLQSLIPSLLQFGILGYSYALPDMIGGNNYKPSAELWIRWLQANAFMPAFQFSIVPWSYPEDPQLTEITKSILALREENWHEILKAVNDTISDGTPINRPMFWVDPNDQETFTLDDQYMLGDNILVAPVLTENSTSRDIYLPRGTWLSNIGVTYDGPIWLRSYSAPIHVLPYFKRL